MESVTRAWPAASVGVVLAPTGADDQEALDRDDAYRAAGWEVRPAGSWSPGALAARIGSADTTAAAVGEPSDSDSREGAQ